MVDPVIIPYSPLRIRRSRERFILWGFKTGLNKVGITIKFQSPEIGIYVGPGKLG